MLGEQCPSGCFPGIQKDLEDYPGIHLTAFHHAMTIIPEEKEERKKKK